MPIDANSGDFVASLARGLDVIKAFGRPGGPAGAAGAAGGGDAAATLSEIAARTGLSRAAARRFLLTLQALGYVAGDGKFFRLTPQVMDLGFAYLDATPLPQIVGRYLEEITETVRESSSASVLDGQEVVYVARVATKHIMSIALNVGTRLPAFCTSMGRVLLAARPDEELAALLAGPGRRAYTGRTVTDAAGLLEILRRTRREGYALVDQELEEGLRSIAVPVRTRGGHVAAAINVSTHAARVTKAEMTKSFLPVLQRAAQAIQTVLPG